MERVALEERIILLLLNTLGDGLFITFGKVTGDRFALFTSFGAF